MPNDILVSPGTKIVLANTTHAPGASVSNNLGARTDQIDLTGLGFGAARQSVKFDFGPQWARVWSLGAAMEAATAFVLDEGIKFFIGYSDSPTAGQANPAGLSGLDAVYTGYSSNLTESLKQLGIPLGFMPLTIQFTPAVQVMMNIRAFMPMARYGILVVLNTSVSDNLVADAVEMSVVLSPLKDQIQATV